MNTAHFVVAGCIGVITMIVSVMALRQHSTFGAAAVPIGICSGLLAMVGIMDQGKEWISGLLIPWATLGIAIILMLLLMCFAGLWRRIAGAGDDGGNGPGKKWKKPEKNPLSRGRSGAIHPPIGSLLRSQQEQEE